MAKLSRKDVELLAAGMMALRAFQVLGAADGAADLSRHYGREDIERVEYLMETLDEETIRAALANTESDIAHATRRGRAS